MSRFSDLRDRVKSQIDDVDVQIQGLQVQLAAAQALKAGLQADLKDIKDFIVFKGGNPNG